MGTERILLNKKQVNTIIKIIGDKRIVSDKLKTLQFQNINSENKIVFTNSYIAVTLNTSFPNSFDGQQITLESLTRWYKIANNKDILDLVDLETEPSDAEYPNLINIMNTEQVETNIIGVDAVNMVLIQNLFELGGLEYEICKISASGPNAYRTTCKLGTAVIAGMRFR